MTQDSVDWRVVSPTWYKDMTVVHAFSQVNWTDQLRSYYQRIVNRGRHLARCDFNGKVYQVLLVHPSITYPSVPVGVLVCFYSRT